MSMDDSQVSNLRLIERPPVIWLTGLSGAGKSTIATHLKSHMMGQGLGVVILDGDDLRNGLCKGLGFSSVDRAENVRRVGEVARLFRNAGVCVIAALISPFIKDRAAVRELIADGFLEIFVDTPLAICQQRDSKGLYAKVSKGDIHEFTGLSSPYEAPLAPDVHLDGATGKTVEEHVHTILEALKRRGYLPSC